MTTRRILGFSRGAIVAILSVASLQAQYPYTYPQSISFAAPGDQTLGSPPFMINATASSGLRVTLSSNSPGVCTLSGSNVTLVSAGTCSITATQPGDSYYSAASPVTRTFNVKAAGKTSQTINFPAISTHTFGDPAFQLNATGGASGNPVTFRVSSGPATISGTTLTITGVGTVTVQASEDGNSSYDAATATQTFTVNKGSQSITFAPIPSHGGADAPFTLQATASSGLPITFSVVSGPAAVSGAMLTLSGVGTVTVQANQDGADNYNAATPMMQTFTVNLAAPAISLAQNAASYGSMLAPSSYVVLFGASFDAQPSTKAPATAKVTIKDSQGMQTSANMLYSDFRQINLLIPSGLAPGAGTLTVSNSAGTSAPYAITIGTVAPGLFTGDFSGKGPAAAQALVIAADGTRSFVPVAQCSGSPLVCSTVTIPQASGSQVYLILYGTGIRGRSGLPGVSIQVGNTPGTVTYAGAQGDFPGLDQIDVLTSASLAGAGEVDLKLIVDNMPANTVRVRF